MQSVVMFEGQENIEITSVIYHLPPIEGLSCIRIGEGNGNPLQCSYLENPRDSGAWWAAVCGVTQSQTQLKRLSSSSNMYQDSHLILHNHQISFNRFLFFFF